MKSSRRAQKKLNTPFAVNIPGLARKYKSARRLQQIINVFLKYGFGQIIDQVHLGLYIPFKKRLKSFGSWPSIKGPTAAERLRMAFADLGPSFIKLAQILSSRPDLITEQFAEEFRKLQDEVPPFSSSEVRRIIEEELQQPLESVFVDFDMLPVAAASIAQVHKAVLRSGEYVVVKVQRPRIREHIEADISIMTYISQLLERSVPESRFFNPTGLVEEFSRTVRKELNFLEEARSCARLRRNFEKFPGVHIPYVHGTLSTEKILVFEMIFGVRVDNIQAIEEMGIDKKALARHGLNVYFKQILEDGFFHADPHPGNFLVEPGGSIAFLDFGIMGRVSEDVKEIMAGTFLSLMHKDFEGLLDHYIELGIVPDEIDTDAFRKEFRMDLEDLLEPLYGLQLHEISFAQFIETIMHLAVKYKLKIPSELLLVDKTLMMLEGLCRKLDPEIDLIAAAEPYASKMALKGMSPSRIYEKTRKNIKELTEFFTVVPMQFKKLLKNAARGELQIKMHHVNLSEFIRDMDKASNRIAFAMIVSAIILSSAIMHAAGVIPTVFGLSFLGIVSFGVALLLGLWLIVSIIRSGRL